jgi:hypothetical protein
LFRRNRVLARFAPNDFASIIYNGRLEKHDVSPFQATAMAKKIKLQQDQVWKRGEEYLRILHLERLEVEYKSVKSLTTRAGTRHHVSKKDFCRLLKTAHLMTLEEIQKSWYH